MTNNMISTHNTGPKTIKLVRNNPTDRKIIHLTMLMVLNQLMIFEVAQIVPDQFDLF